MEYTRFTFNRNIVGSQLQIVYILKFCYPFVVHHSALFIHAVLLQICPFTA
jgi:hypothetical protein